MAFTDPLTIDIGAGSVTLPRVSTGANTSTYTSADGTVSVRADSNYARRTRRVLRLDTNKVTSDPFIPSQNQKVSMSTYVVFDLPVAGYTNAQAMDAFEGFSALYSASSNLLIAKLLGGES
jgi:hypothetical protein